MRSVLNLCAAISFGGVVNLVNLLGQARCLLYTFMVYALATWHCKRLQSSHPPSLVTVRRIFSGFRCSFTLELLVQNLRFDPHCQLGIPLACCI